MKIEPAASVEGAIAVPGVKGISQRAVLLGGLADGVSEIRGFGAAADTEAAISVVRQLGVQVSEADETVRVRGAGLRGLREPEDPLDCGNAGTVLRLVSGILAGQEGRFVLTGDESLSRRPHERIAEPLRRMGARVETTNGGAPLLIEGGKLLTFLFDARTGRRGDRQTTGNAGRSSYRTPPSVSTTNLVLEDGDASLDELVARAGDGLYVASVAGLHSGVNPVSGTFSVGATGRLIENGELGRPVREITIASDLVSMLKAVEAVGAPGRWVPFGGSVRSAPVLIAEMQVSGA